MGTAPGAAAQPYTLTGYAYTGGGRKITRCEASLDGGLTWRLADMERPEMPTKRAPHATPFRRAAPSHMPSHRRCPDAPWGHATKRCRANALRCVALRCVAFHERHATSALRLDSGTCLVVVTMVPYQDWLQPGPPVLRSQTRNSPTLRCRRYGKYWCWVFFKVVVDAKELLSAAEVCCRTWDAGNNTQPAHITWRAMLPAAAPLPGNSALHLWPASLASCTRGTLKPLNGEWPHPWPAQRSVT